MDRAVLLGASAGGFGYAGAMPQTVTLFHAAEEAARRLPMPPYVFGLTAFIILLALLGITWAFRNTSQRYVGPDDHDHAQH